MVEFYRPEPLPAYKAWMVLLFPILVALLTTGPKGLSAASLFSFLNYYFSTKGHFR